MNAVVANGDCCGATQLASERIFDTHLSRLANDEARSPLHEHRIALLYDRASTLLHKHRWRTSSGTPSRSRFFLFFRVDVHCHALTVTHIGPAKNNILPPCPAATAQRLPKSDHPARHCSPAKCRKHWAGTREGAESHAGRGDRRCAWDARDVCWRSARADWRAGDGQTRVSCLITILIYTGPITLAHVYVGMWLER